MTEFQLVDEKSKLGIFKIFATIVIEATGSIFSGVSLVDMINPFIEWGYHCVKKFNKKINRIQWANNQSRRRLLWT